MENKDCKDCQEKDIEALVKNYQKRVDICEQMIKNTETQLENSREIMKLDNEINFKLNALFLLFYQDCKDKIEKFWEKISTKKRKIKTLLLPLLNQLQKPISGSIISKR